MWPKGSSPTYVSLDIPAESKRTSRQRTLHKVPPQVREKKKHIYDPLVVSLGPYHHGQPQFDEGETLKDEIVDIMLNSGHRAKDIWRQFHEKNLERMDEIRSFYGGLSKDEYEDEALVEMMLRDACFILYIMELQTEKGYEKQNLIVRRLGMSRVAYIKSDLLVLENQIPLWVIKLLIALTCDDDDCVPLLYKFMSYKRLGNHNLARVLWEDGEQEEHLHLLDAFRASLFKDESSTNDPMQMKGNYPVTEFRWRRNKSCKSSSFFEQIDSPFGSVTELKAKGIQCSRSSNCFKDIRFDSYLFCGKLQLPTCIVSDTAIRVLSNMIAFEMSPESETDLALTSYAAFMKSLIQKPEDVKELREKGIIVSALANNDEVVKIFREVDGYVYNIFHDVKMRIKDHCNSKAGTWLAELLHTYFRTPWNALALFAAIILLGLTFLQTYYAMNPRNSCSN